MAADPSRPDDGASGAPAEGGDEYTIDELAARAGMTVRNVRAYAGRGLIEPPRLEGRTGYYHRGHLQRLRLVREFLDRGYTLAAVEKAVLSSPVAATGPALDLLQLLDEPGRDVEPEVMTRDALAALAHVPREDALIDALVDFGLVEWIEGDDESVRVLYPAIVRNGAAAVSLGLPAAEVIALFPAIRDHLRAVADEFVGRAVSTIIRPFIDRGLPAEDAPAVLSTVEQLLPVASQVTYAMFRHELSAAIEQEIGAQLDEIGSQLRGSRTTPPAR